MTTSKIEDHIRPEKYKKKTMRSLYPKLDKTLAAVFLIIAQNTVKHR